MIVEIVLLLLPVVMADDTKLTITDLSQCIYQVEPVGCFQDNPNENRTLPVQIINSRDSTDASVYLQPEIQWSNMDHFLANFICECAKRVVEENHGDYLGIQFYGECWSGFKNQPESANNYNSIGFATSCKDGDYRLYDGNNTKCQVYTGMESTNYVYRISKYTAEPCSEYFQSIGCFNDNQKEPRPLSDYIQNERDYTIDNFNGKLIDWNNWDTYKPGLICRCAKAARESNHTYFGLQFYGECWGSNDETAIKRDGPASEGQCIDKLGRPPVNCPSDEEDQKKKKCLPTLCVGKAKTNKVYELKQGPLACLSSPCKNGSTCKANGVTDYKCI